MKGFTSISLIYIRNCLFLFIFLPVSEAYSCIDLKTQLSFIKCDEANQSKSRGCYDFASKGKNEISLYAKIKVPSTQYIIGDRIIVQITLMDSHGNPVKGMSDLLMKKNIVTIPGTVTYNISKWSEYNDGTYFTDRVAEKIGENYRVTIHLCDKLFKSDPYSITPFPESFN